MTILPGVDNLQIDARKLVYLLTSGKAGFFISHGFSLLRPSGLDTATARPAAVPACAGRHGGG